MSLEFFKMLPPSVIFKVEDYKGKTFYTWVLLIMQKNYSRTWIGHSKNFVSFWGKEIGEGNVT